MPGLGTRHAGIPGGSDSHPAKTLRVLPGARRRALDGPESSAKEGTTRPGGALMTIRTDLAEGWVLRLADDANRTAVPAHVRAALPIAATVPGTVHTRPARRRPHRRSLPGLRTSSRSTGSAGSPGSTSANCGTRSSRASRSSSRSRGSTRSPRSASTTSWSRRTQNMHRRYEIPIRDSLRDGGNLLSVRFDSGVGIRRSRARAARAAAQPVPGSVQLRAQDGLQLRLGLGTDARHRRHLAAGDPDPAHRPAHPRGPAHGDRRRTARHRERSTSGSTRRSRRPRPSRRPSGPRG